MNIQIKIDKTLKEFPTDGLVSTCCFERESFLTALDVMFKTKKNEKIIAIEIDENGIKAFFRSGVTNAEN